MQGRCAGAADADACCCMVRWLCWQLEPQYCCCLQHDLLRPQQAPLEYTTYTSFTTAAAITAAAAHAVAAAARKLCFIAAAAAATVHWLRLCCEEI
jgi:hypothetical protein